MNDKRVNQYLILPEAGQRKDTKLAVEYSEEQIAEYLKQGYVIVNQADFNKLIGNADGVHLPMQSCCLQLSKQNSLKSANGQQTTSRAVLSAAPAASLCVMTATKRRNLRCKV